MTLPARLGAGFLREGALAGAARETARAFLGRLREAGWSLADQCVVSACNFLTIYLLARNMPASPFGAFMLCYTGLQLLTSIQSALVTQPHNVLGAPLTGATYRRFTGSLAIMQALLCALLCTALALAGWLIAAQWSPPTGLLLMTLAAAAGPWMAQEFVRRVLYTRSESRAAAANDAISYGLQLLGLLALLTLVPHAASPRAALAVLGGSSLAAALFGAWQLRAHATLSGLFGTGELARCWSEAWQFGKWLVGQTGLVWLGAQGHSWVIGLLLGTEQVGIYRAVTHLANVMNPVLQTAYSNLPPRASRAYHAGGPAALARWVGQASWLMLGVLAPLLILLAGFPEAVLHAAYADKYSGPGLATLLALSSLAQCIVFVKFAFDSGLLALRATRSIFRVYLIPVLLLCTSGVALIFVLGTTGAALSGIVINSALLLATRRAFGHALDDAGARHDRRS